MYDITSLFLQNLNLNVYGNENLKVLTLKPTLSYENIAETHLGNSSELVKQDQKSKKHSRFLL